MMLHKTQWMTLEPESQYCIAYWIYGDENACCCDELASIFDIPEDAWKMRFLAYDRPGRFRVQVTKLWHFATTAIVQDAKIRITTWLAQHLDKVNRRNFYLECEYR